MSTNTRRLLVFGILLVAVFVLIVGTVWIAWFFFSPSLGMGPMRGPFIRPFFRGFESNGERIYFTGASETGPPITAEIPGMHRMRPSMQSCADCHGADGRGGTVRMMMSTFAAPDIRYRTLTGEDHAEAHADHPPYTDEDIKLAITAGVDPAGEPLAWMMPRWEMSAEQLEDLLSYLKTLE